MLGHHTGAMVGIAVFLVCLVGNFATITAQQSGPTIYVWTEPIKAVRGHTLRLTAYSPDPALNNCSFQFTDSVIPLDSWASDSVPKAEVWVLPTASDSLTGTVQCSNETKNFTVDVEWGLQMQLDYSMDPNPADLNKRLTVSVNVTNLGPEPAQNVNCSFASSAGATNADEQLKDIFMPSEVFSRDIVWTNVTGDNWLEVECTSFGQLLVSKNISLLTKGDADIALVSVLPQKVTAGEDFTTITTISNSGRAQADKLVCTLSVDPTQITYLGTNDTRCRPEYDTANVTKAINCALGDMKSSGSISVSLNFHSNASVPATTKIKHDWNCAASGLPAKSFDFNAAVQVKASIDISLRPNATLFMDATRAIYFDIKNDGPSDLDEAECKVKFLDAGGVYFSSRAHSNYFTCVNERSDDNLIVTCHITHLPAGKEELNLALHVNNTNLQSLAVNASCTSAQAGESKHAFTIDIVKASPSPTPNSPQTPPTTPPPDNSMVVVVTVIVALGLLIVVVIWWRRRQERSGWDEGGPSGRRPSINRFTDMELSVRSDD